VTIIDFLGSRYTSNVNYHDITAMKEELEDTKGVA
jgi:hypothetical protein